MTGIVWPYLEKMRLGPPPRIRVQPSGCISDLDDDRPFALLAHSAVCGLQTGTPGKAVAQLHLSVLSE
jgi:hypothetical protein